MADNQRREPRYIYFHKVTLEDERIYATSYTMDVSSHGVQVTVDKELDEIGGYLVNFYIQKELGLEKPETIFERSGVVRWIFHDDGQSTVGIEFDKEIEMSVEEWNELVSEDDYCYLHIHHNTKASFP